VKKQTGGSAFQQEKVKIHLPEVDSNSVISIEKIITKTLAGYCLWVAKDGKNPGY
jgi:predicted SprT family Zn-dependent metalloprotease